MKAIRRLQKYLKACGIECSCACAYELSSEFPVAIAARYDAQCVKIFDKSYIAVEPKSGVQPDELVMHCRQIATLHHVIAVLDFADQEYSECLRKAKVDYIVPGRQIYVPPYAVLIPPEAYERFDKVFLRDFLSPWAQVILFRIMLFHADEESVPYAELSKELSVRDVYLTRACQELEYHQLATLGKVGRNRFVRLPCDRRLLWQSAEKCLRSPILRRIRYAGKLGLAVTAGYPALVALSDLASEDDPVLAITLAEARKLDKRKIQKYSGVQVEVWRYDPKLLARDGHVDPLSLYMSLKDSPDARVQIALADLLENTL